MEARDVSQVAGIALKTLFTIIHMSSSKKERMSQLTTQCQKLKDLNAAIDLQDDKNGKEMQALIKEAKAAIAEAKILKGQVEAEN